MTIDSAGRIRPVVVKTASQEAYEALRREIIRGLPPGTALRLADLADRYQLSTMPVRSALARLEAEGLVTRKPRRGAVVAEMSPTDFIDMYTIRAALEGTAARLGVANLTDGEIGGMRKALGRMEALAGSGGDATDSYLRLDWEMHDICYGASGRPRLLRLIDLHRAQSERYFRLYLRSQLSLAEDFLGQKEFVTACADRDPGRAARVQNSLFDRTIHDLGPYLDKTPPPARRAPKEEQ